MSFSSDGCSSVFGCPEDEPVDWGPLTWIDFVDSGPSWLPTPTAIGIPIEAIVGAILDSTGNDSGDPVPTPNAVIPAIPVVDSDDEAPITLPPLVFGPVGAGSGGAAATVPVITPNTPLEDIPEEIIFEDVIPEVLLGGEGSIDPYEPPVIVPEGFGDAHLGEGDDMAVDWGDVLGSALGTVASGLTNPNQNIGNVGVGGGSPPAKVTVDTRTGKITPCRRRRRRRLLTPTDMADLASLQTLVGKGSDAMKFAVTKAVRR